MGTIADDCDDGEDPLDGILADFLQAVEQGDAPSADTLIERFPHFRVELEDFFSARKHFEQAVEPFRIACARASVGAGVLADGQAANAAEAGDSETCRDRPGGPRLFGPYELFEELGRGGMGVVYRARHRQLDRVVALKMILAGQFATQEEVSRFQVEAQNAARLDHPNIVPIYEVGQHGRQHYFTMKLIEGGSLTNRIRSFVGHPRAAARLVVDIARAVDYAHRRGVLHRDLKPGNVLLDPDGRPQITDFGLAQRLEGDGGGMTVSGAVLGSPRYMAPEQARGCKSVTVAADVWGVGAILYELLCGTPPFIGSSILDTLNRVRATEPPSFASLGVHVPRDLQTICLRCMEKEPHRRYAAARDVADELTRWAEGQPILSRPVGPVERAWRWCRRNPSLASLAGCAAAALVLGIVLLVGLSYQGRLRLALQGEREAHRREEVQRISAQRSAADVAAQKRLTEAALTRSETYAYLARIAWAEREYLANDPARALQILDECPVAMRRWEWDYLRRLCHAEITALPNSAGTRLLVAGTRPQTFLTVGGQGAVAQWQPDGTRVPVPFPSLPGATAMATCLDDRVLLVGYANGTVKIWKRGAADSEWNSTTLLVPGKPVAPPPPRGGEQRAVRAAAISDDGRWAAAADAAQAVHVWDLETGDARFTFTGHAARINAIAFGPGGHLLASCSGEPSRLDDDDQSIPERAGEVKVWDLAKGQLDRTLSNEGVAKSAILGLTFVSGDVIACSQSDGNVKVWEISSRRVVNTLRGHVGNVFAVRPSGDGGLLVTAGADQTLRVWSPVTGEQLAVYRGHSTAVQNVLFLGGDSRLVSVAPDGVRIWDATSGAEARVIKAWATDVVFSRDSSKLTATGAWTIQWDVNSGRELWRWYTPKPAWGPRVSLSGDGTRLTMSASSGVIVLDHGSGAVLRRFDGDRITPAAISRDGRLVAAASPMERSVEIWDAETTRRIRTLTTTPAPGVDPVFDLAFSPDDRFIIGVGGAESQNEPRKEGGRVRMWERGSGRLVRTFEGAVFCCWSVALSADGKWLAIGGGLYGNPASRPRYQGPGGEVRVWEVATGRQVFQADRKDCVFRVRFSPDGSRLASAGGQGRRPPTNDIVLTDTEVWRDVIRLAGHRDAVEGLAFSDDGRMIASSSRDGTVRIWDAPPLRPATTRPATRQ